MFRRSCRLLGAAALFAAAIAPLRAGEGLELVEVRKDNTEGKRLTIPGDAVRVFAYEGQPNDIRVTKDAIALSFPRSGVLIDRATGRVARRLTVADGWPEARPAPFGKGDTPWRGVLVGPGVHYRGAGEKAPVVVASTTHDGRTWNAVQPGDFLSDLTRRHDYAEIRRKLGGWTPILRLLNEQCHLEAGPLPGEPARRHTVKDGLASNVVTHLAAHGERLWAACADIYDPDKGAWGPGGLCRLDRGGRWHRVQIDGRPVRWVTLLESVGDELWVGYREGDGVAGDVVTYGKGLYPDHYRPRTTAVVLARLKGGKWSRFARPPRLDEAGAHAPGGRDTTKDPSTEVPRQLARAGDQVVLFSTLRGSQGSGNWHVPLDGALSLLDLESGRWRLFAPAKDLGAGQLAYMVAGEGEVLVASDRGAHRWDTKLKAWRRLDTGAALLNPAVGAAAAVGDELWVGYDMAFSAVSERGISRYDERTGRWSHLSRRELGTAAPVRAIAASPQRDVWVVFAPRPYFGQAAAPPFVDRANPLGVGRFHKGKWTFPVRPEGVPTSRLVDGFGEDGKPAKVKWPVDFEHVALAGDRVFLANAIGVFQGPEKWQRILDGPVLLLSASADGKRLLVTRSDPAARSGQESYQQGTFDVGKGKWAFRPRTAEEVGEARADGLRPGRTLTPESFTAALGPDAGKKATWTLSHTAREPRLIATPRALWLVSDGELVRLDRQRLAALLRKAAE